MNQGCNILFFLSASSALALFCPATGAGVIVTGAVGALLLFLYRKYHLRFSLVRRPAAFLAAIPFHVIYIFYSFVPRWLPSSKAALAAGLFHAPLEPFLIGVGAVLSVFSSLFAAWLLCLLGGWARSESLVRSIAPGEGCQGTEAAKLSAAENICLLLCAVGLITICSKSSFLYPFNNWPDVNCYFTVGKAMFRGDIPYRDLYDHKGPLLFFLYGLAGLVSKDSFLGGYLLEIVAARFFLKYSYCSFCLLAKKRCPILIPVFALLAFSSKAFEQGGGAEELVLPFLAFSLWLMLRWSTGFCKPRELVALGFAAGCVFWIKFSLIGMYLGWYLVFAAACVKEGAWKRLGGHTGRIALGVVLATLPWVLYFGIHGAIADWLQVYLHDNLFVYTETEKAVNIMARIPVLGSLLNGMRNFWRHNFVVFLLCAVCLFSALTLKKEKIGPVLLGTVLGSFLLIYIGGRHFAYYSLILNIFIAPGLAFLLRFPVFERWGEQLPASPRALTAALLVCLAAALVFTPNRYYMRKPREELVQYRFAEIISDDPREDVTLLTYGSLDRGFYTACRIEPSCKAFCQMNMSGPSVDGLQDRYVENGWCDYLVTYSKEAMAFEKYECLAEYTPEVSYYDDGYMTYRLYRLKE